ncbi:hypothetical protein C8Q77DRAFT_1114586 [Trametes polyzona]|nr:hypothetical protein C8Q77DRAFT_1114586 [Trametes polyzona]
MLTAFRRSLLRRTRDLLLARWGLLDWLRLLWCSVVLWYELGSFHSALRSCSWPDAALPAHQERPAHVLLVADPQVRDPVASSRLGLSAYRQFVVDLALKRNWHFASRTRPDVVVFLGDLLASWRLIKSDEEYERNLHRFKSIFHLPSSVTSFYVPGNNDVGLNIEPAFARQARHRFTTHFGPLNQAVVLRNHTLVMLDAAGLAEEDYQRAAKYTDFEHWSAIPHGPVEFVRSLQSEGINQPKILFTHIPLHRPDSASCGPLREKGNIHRGVGPGYQNTLGKKTTTFLFQTIHPSLVFSADDKDYCEYTHVPPKLVGTEDAMRTNDVSAPTVREVTLKAFAPTNGLRYPGFQLLSLASPIEPQTGLPAHADRPCFFPDYTRVYSSRYPPLLFVTIITLIILRLRKSRASSLPLHARRNAFRKTFSIHTLPPDAPWLNLPHPPTPFTQDWGFPSLGFVSPRSPHSPRESFSPTDELPRSIRTPVPGDIKRSDSHLGSGTPSTPTFRATTHTRDDGLANGAGLAALPPRLVVFDADGAAHDEHEHDEFARGLHDPRRLTRAARGFDADPDVDAVDREASLLDFTFTFGGHRRRVSVANIVPAWARRLSLRDWELGRFMSMRRGGKRAFARRVGLDFWYIAWPAVLLWTLCAWGLQ